QKRGENTLIPNQPGRRENPLRDDETTHTIEVDVLGIVDIHDELADDEFAQLDENIDLLVALGDTIDAQAIGVVRSDGSTATGMGHVIVTVGDLIDGEQKVTLDLRMLRGRVAPEDDEGS